MEKTGMWRRNKKPFLRKKRFFNVTMPPKLIAKLKNSQPFNPSTLQIHLPGPNRNRHLPTSIYAAPYLLADRAALKRRMDNRKPARSP